MHDALPLRMDVDGATRTATIVRVEHPPDVAVLPLGAWLEPALALPLIEIALDVTIRTPVIVSSPACAVVRGLIGQRLRDLRCLTGAPTCSGCPVAAACDYGRIFEGGSPHSFWIQGIPATTELDPGAQFAARLYLAAPAHTVAQYLDVTLRDALRALDPDAVLSASQVRSVTLGELMPAAPPPPEDGQLHLRTETPLWLRGDEELCRALCPRVPWLALLARAGIRRLDALVRAFAPPAGGKLPRAELPDLVTVELIRGAFTPWSSSRFSHRQHQRMPLEGLQGDAVVHGPHLAALAPLLRALTVTSVGKSTSLGLGTLRVVTP